MLFELEVGAIADGAVCCGSELARLSALLGDERSDKGSGGDDNAGRPDRRKIECFVELAQR